MYQNRDKVDLIECNPGHFNKTVGNRWSSAVIFTFITITGFACVCMVILLSPVYLGIPMFTGQGTVEHSSSIISNDCRITIAESIPENLTFPTGSPFHSSTFDCWMELINSANKTIDIASFYWTLRGSDTGTADPSVRQGEAVLANLIHAVKDRSIKLRIVKNNDAINDGDDDTTELVNAGADVRSVDFKALFGSGVLHTKLWLVDGSKMYIGSANMDWRSLTQVKELGAYITSCPGIVEDAAKLFDVYWYLGTPNTRIPRSWPSRYNTDYNILSPMNVQLNKSNSLVYMSSSPPPFCPHGRATDLDAILNVIYAAKQFIHIAVMDYLPSILYAQDKSFWPIIDDALRKVSLEKGIKVRLLASKWQDTNRYMATFLRSLVDISGAMHADIQVKLFIVPAFTPAQAEIPFARVNHNKYMVTDNTAYIGTSNWIGDYFETTAGVGLVINQPLATQPTVQQLLVNIFDRDWNSSYAHPLTASSDTSLNDILILRREE